MCVHLPSCSCLQTVSEKIFCSEPKSTVGGGGGSCFFAENYREFGRTGNPFSARCGFAAANRTHVHSKSRPEVGSAKCIGASCKKGVP